MKPIPQNKVIVIDTGFWFALYDERGGYHQKANNLADIIGGNNILIPWPTLYETINTRFVKNKLMVASFETFLKDPNTIPINDINYRENDLSDVFQNSRKLSLVDKVIRSILVDRSFNINYLITFNLGDFIDICINRKIEILNGE